MVGAERVGSDHQKPIWAAPKVEPTTKKSSVAMSLPLPPPSENSVPEAQPPPICMPMPKSTAPSAKPTPIGGAAPDSFTSSIWPREDREEQERGQRQHHGVGGDATPVALVEKPAEGVGEAEGRPVEHEANGGAGEHQQRHLPARARHLRNDPGEGDEKGGRGAEDEAVGIEAPGRRRRIT